MATPSSRRLLTALLAVAFLVAIKGEDACQTDAIQFTTTDALGPFYVGESERTTVIAPRQLLINPADVFTVNGKVIGNDCVPLAGARVEAWYAGLGIGSMDGVYLDDGFRGQVLTDACGNFQFTQTFPGVYPQRPIPHIHYRISSADDTELLVTQLYFEGAIVAGFSPDDTKISTVTNEADGSRSAQFNVYVSIPGTADMSACRVSGEGSYLFLNSTTTPGENITITTLPIEEDTTLMPSEDGLIGVEEDTEDDDKALLAQCGSVVCEAGLVCCNASCGTCAEPGAICRPIGCVEAAPTDIADTEFSISKSSPDLFN